MQERQTSTALASLTPRVRTAGLVVRELAGELIVYDLGRHRAHCLGDAAAAVWRRCDGRTSVSEIARAVAEERGETLGPRAVLAAVRRFERAHLLESPLPRRCAPEPMARRSLLRGMAVTGGLAVLSLTVPTPEAAAATCLPAGTCVRAGSCTDLQGNRCCNGCGGGGQTCGVGQGLTQVCN